MGHCYSRSEEKSEKAYCSSQMDAGVLFQNETSTLSQQRFKYFVPVRQRLTVNGDTHTFSVRVLTDYLSEGLLSKHQIKLSHKDTAVKSPTWELPALTGSCR